MGGEAAGTREVPAVVVWGSGALCDRSALQVSPSPSVGLAAGVAAPHAQRSAAPWPQILPRVRTPCGSAAKLGVVLTAPEGLEMMPTAAGASV